MKPVFDDNGLAIKPGEIRCFYFCPVTGEYTGWSDEYINIGVSMPGDSTDAAPGNDVAGKVAVFSGTGWVWQEDLRGETVYSTEDRRETIIDYIGPVHDGFTRMPPATPYDHWDGEKWITDTAAERDAHIAADEAKKQFLIDQANAYINSKQWPGKAAIGRLTGDELARYNLWLDYLDKLEAVDTSSSPDISWPIPPEV